MSDMGDYLTKRWEGQTGRTIPNQEIRYYQNGSCAFYSYNTKIAEVDLEGDVTLFDCWDMYSKTTNKYFLKFLRMHLIFDDLDDITSITQVRKLVKNKTFSLAR